MTSFCLVPWVFLVDRFDCTNSVFCFARFFTYDSWLCIVCSFLLRLFLCSWFAVIKIHMLCCFFAYDRRVFIFGHLSISVVGKKRANKPAWHCMPITSKPCVSTHCQQHVWDTPLDNDCHIGLFALFFSKGKQLSTAHINLTESLYFWNLSFMSLWLWYLNKPDVCIRWHEICMWIVNWLT